MSLTWLELQKLLRRRTARLALLLSVGYLLLGVLLTWQLMHGTPNTAYSGGYYVTTGHQFDGRSRMRWEYEQAQAARGPLTDERVRELAREWQGHWDALDGLKGEEHMDYLDRNLQAHDDLFSLLWQVCQIPGAVRDRDLADGILAEERPFSEVFRDARQARLAEIGDRQDRAYFSAMAAQVQLPLQYDWVGTWRELTAQFGEFGMILAISLCIGLSPVFSMERQLRTDAILLAGRHGRGRLARAKVQAALLYTLLLFGLCAGLFLGLQAFFFGLHGWDQPLQLIDPMATLPINVLQMEGLTFLYAAVTCFALCGVVTLISSLLRSSFACMALSVLAAFAPMTLLPMMPAAVRKFLMLLPLGSGAEEWVRTNVYHLFGLHIWAPWLVNMAPLLIGAVCLYLAARLWSRRQAA